MIDDWTAGNLRVLGGTLKFLERRDWTVTLGAVANFWYLGFSLDSTTARAKQNQVNTNEWDNKETQRGYKMQREIIIHINSNKIIKYAKQMN
jgi:hypothetical protein